MYLVGAPLLVIPFAIYNIIAFLMPGVSWSAPVTHVQLMSGAEWTMSVGDILVAVTALILIVEVIKFARIGTRSLVDHALALLLLFGMTAEFVWVSSGRDGGIFPDAGDRICRGRRRHRRLAAHAGAAARVGDRA